MDSTVAIVGAGPVGLFTALLLGKAGIKVAVFEKENDVVQSPRALGYATVVLAEFAKAGILEDVEKVAYQASKGVAWKDPRGKNLAVIEPPPFKGKTYFSLMIGQHEVGAILIAHLKKLPNVSIHWDHTFTKLEQTEKGVIASFARGSWNDLVIHTSRFLVGADGGKSDVRHALDIPLEGKTWDDWKFYSANICYDLGKYGWPEVNYIVHPENWAVMLRASKRIDTWRVAYGEKYTPETDENPFDAEAAVQRAREKFKRFLPGPTEDIIFERIAPYTTHQRCAATFVKGQVVLAGDAAHLNNPVGGLGLMTGFMDAAELGPTLIRIINKDADTTETLKTYSESRRNAFLRYTNPISTNNRIRLYGMDKETAREREYHFQMINEPNFPYIMNMAMQENSISTTLHVL